MRLFRLGIVLVLSLLLHAEAIKRLSPSLAQEVRITAVQRFGNEYKVLTETPTLTLDNKTITALSTTWEEAHRILKPYGNPLDGVPAFSETAKTLKGVNGQGFVRLHTYAPIYGQRIIRIAVTVLPSRTPITDRQGVVTQIWVGSK